jgi:hypothetical protein
MTAADWPARTLLSGTCAAIASAVVLAACGRRETGYASAPLNAPSQWIWGKGATRANDFSLRHTVLGYAVHHAGALIWAGLFEALRERMGHRPADTLRAAALTTAIGNMVDFQLTPERFTPGFQHRLSRGALLGVYVAFGAGLAAGALLGPRPLR